MLNKDLVDVAYDFMVDYLQKYGSEKTTLEFSEISRGIQKIIQMSDGEFNKLLGSLYVDLMQDGRFVYLGSDKWTLKDLISLELYNKNQNSLYNYENGRFVYLGSDKWTLKDLISLELYNKNQNSLYNYENGTPFTEVYDEDALPEEMVNEDNEVYEENENEISRDSFENDVNSELEYDEEDDMSDSDKDDDIVVDDESAELDEDDDK